MKQKFTMIFSHHIAKKVFRNLKTNYKSFLIIYFSQSVCSKYIHVVKSEGVPYTDINKLYMGIHVYNMIWLLTRQPNIKS